MNWLVWYRHGDGTLCSREVEADSSEAAAGVLLRLMNNEVKVEDVEEGEVARVGRVEVGRDEHGVLSF